MAVSAVEVACSPENDPTGGTSTSFTCNITAEKLYILQIWADDTDGSGVEYPTSITASGGRSFTKIDDQSLLTGWAGASSWRMCPSSGGTGVSFTIAFATARGTTMWRMIELDGTTAVSSDNGAAAIIQHVERTSSNTSANVTFTLATFADANNACVMGDTCYRDGSTISSTGSTGFTEIVDDNFVIEGTYRAHMSFYLRTTAVTNPQITLNANVANNFGWALEVGTAGAGSQSITASLFTDSDSFFASTVSRTINASLFTDADSFFTSTIIQQQFITGGLFSDADSFFGSVVALGGAPQSITGSLYSDADSFNVATLTTTYSVTAARYNDDDSFFASTITPGAAAIIANRYDDTDTFSTASVGGSYTITASRFDDSDSFNNHALTTIYNINVDRYDNPNLFLGASVIGTQVIDGVLYSDVDNFLSSTITQQQFINADRFDDSDVFFVANVDDGTAPTTVGGLLVTQRRRRRC